MDSNSDARATLGTAIDSGPIDSSRHARPGRRAWFPCALVSTILVSVIGCMSITEIAPPVNGPVVDVAQDMGEETGSVARGRVIYLTTCIECHRAYPVNDYSMAAWPAIFEDMAEQSRLDEQAREELWAYIRVAHEYLSTRAQTAAGQ